MSRAFGFTANAYRGPAMYGRCGCKSAGGTARHCGIVSDAPADTPYCACQCHGVTPYEADTPLPTGHLPYVFNGVERYFTLYDSACPAPVTNTAGTLTVTKVERDVGVMTVAPSGLDDRYVSCECGRARRSFLMACPSCQEAEHLAEVEAARKEAREAYVVGGIDPYSGSRLVYAAGLWVKLRYQELHQASGELSQVRDRLGDKDREIAELRAEVGRLHVELRRAEKRGSK